MKDWKFEELIECVKESFENYIEEGQTPLDAGSYTIDDFWYFNNTSECVENLIVIVTTLMQIVKHNRVFIGTKELFNTTLDSTSKEILKKSLQSHEIIKLEDMISDLKISLQNVEIVHNPEES